MDQRCGMKMKKFKEIIFLSYLNRVGKKTIYKTYWDMLNESDDFYDFVSDIELTNKFDKENVKKAMSEADKLYDYINSSDINVITVFDVEYPEKLMVMGNDRPLILYVKGNADAITKPNISVIGTRKPSENSHVFEENLVKAVLQNSNRVIVSGLALGCDKIAHQTTVDENKVTIAVLPSGVNVVKPAKHKKLAQDIIDAGGCLISEYLPDAKPNKGSYVERDRIVAAFSDATFVVECGVESGTMHTVRFANDYKRQIYSYLPSERPEGSHDGNEYILEEFKGSIKVEDIEEFIDDLSTLRGLSINL